MWWSCSALETSHVCRMDERYFGGELEAQVDQRHEVWRRLWPRLPEPREACAVTARLRLISKGLDWSTELMDSNFCKLNLSIIAGQKYGFGNMSLLSFYWRFEHCDHFCTLAARGLTEGDGALADTWTTLWRGKWPRLLPKGLMSLSWCLNSFLLLPLLYLSQQIV